MTWSLYTLEIWQNKWTTNLGIIFHRFKLLFINMILYYLGLGVSKIGRGEKR
jgi:hypothetical protein